MAGCFCIFCRIFDQILCFGDGFVPFIFLLFCVFFGIIYHLFLINCHLKPAYPVGILFCDLFCIQPGFVFEWNLFPLFVFFHCCNISFRFQHPFFEFRVSSTDALTIYIAIIILLVGCIDPGKYGCVVTGIEPPVGNDYDPADFIILFDSLDCREQVCLFAFVAGESMERHGNAIGIHKEPHLYDWIFAVFF